MNPFIREEHAHRLDRELLYMILERQDLLTQKIDNLMNKQDFLQAIADLKTEVGTVGAKVDVLEQKINASSTDVDPDIVAAFNDLKTSVDALNSKADNTPAAPAEPPAAG